MLLLSRSQRWNTQAFVCWQCHAKSRLDQTQTFKDRRSTTSNYGVKVSHRCLSIRYTNIKKPSPDQYFKPRVDTSFFGEDTTKSQYRELLRQWEADNKDLNIRSHTDIGQAITPEDVVNLFGTTGNTSEFHVAPANNGNDYDNTSSVMLDRDGLVEAGKDRTFLLPGDMIAIKSFGGEQEMAIFVRNLENQSQFYTMSGRYVHTRSRASDFMIPGFVSRDELIEITPMLPKSDLPQTLENKLQNMGENVPKNIGKPLLEKMLHFWRRAQSIFQSAASQLDNAHNILALENRFRYGTLSQFAEELLASHVEKDVDGRFPAPALFAVHQALTRDDSGFRVQLHGSLRNSIHYEVSSIREVQVNLRVAEEVHKYREDVLHGTRTSSLHDFVQKACKLIDNSRKTRDGTFRGMLGPSKTKPHEENFRFGKVQDVFQASEEIFPLFMESWTALTTFTPFSSLNGVGSTILRAMNRYQNEPLDRSTGWKFIQEIGYIPPWQTMAPYNLRIPATGRRLRIERFQTSTGYTTDKLSEIRNDWGRLAVFCIDDITAMEIDDGVSVEKADRDGEYWVRIHIADPASHMDPRGDAATLAESYTGNFYQQDRVIFMLDPKFVASKLSLAPNKPCLTFSARMNLKGEILDVEVAPGIIRKVIHMTPSLFAKVGEGYSGFPSISHTVGVKTPNEMAVSRPIVEEKDLSPQQIQGLKILHQIARARDEKLQAKGGIMFQKPSAEVSASFGGTKWDKQDQANASRTYHGDPSITVKVPSETDPDRFNSLYKMSAVARLMLTANEVAAHWCNERGIPIPYRKTQTNPGDHPSEFYQQKILPAIKKSGQASEDDMMKYFSLTGRAQLSTTPGPHHSLGVDLIAKATSPLRRYPDLLLHWQIGAALLKEAETGKSLIGNMREDFLPFSRDEIESKLPRISMREKAINFGHTQASRAWLCQFLFRAWKYNEAKLPSPLRVRVVDSKGSTRADGRTEMGTLMDFACSVDMKIPDGIHKEDVKPGDEFEAELANIDVYSQQIQVKGLRRWSLGTPLELRNVLL